MPISETPTPVPSPTEKMPTGQELEAKANKPAEESLRLHALFQGKIQVAPKCPVRDLADFEYWYTPGVAAAIELAKCAEENGLSEKTILPTMADWWVVPRVAAATAMKAQESSLTRVTRSRDEYIETAMRRIQDAQQTVQLLMREGLIAPIPVDRAGRAAPVAETTRSV